MGGLEIIRGEKPRGAMLSDRRLYLTADKGLVVETGDSRAAFLFATPGWEISAGDVERYGLSLVGERVVLPGAAATEPVPANDPPAADGDGEPDGDEEEAVPERDDGLPEDIPARAELLAGGLTTIAAVGDHPDLTELDGIGKATAAKIADYLAGADGGS